MTSIENVKSSDLKGIERYGYRKEPCKSQSEILRLKGDATLVLYKNQRLLIQGSKDNVESAIRILNFLGIGKQKLKGVSVGSDECLKGDTFGGIIVAGVRADDNIREEFEKLNVRDSKKMLNPQVVSVAWQIIEKFPKNCHIEALTPKEFNKLKTKKNITEILDELHFKCYKKLGGAGIPHIVDLYPGCNVGDIRVKQAESKYIEVAAASVIARYAGLKQIRELEQKAGFFIPLGSTNVEPALLEIKKKSLNPADYVKLSFKNVKEFFSL